MKVLHFLQFENICSNITAMTLTTILVCSQSSAFAQIDLSVSCPGTSTTNVTKSSTSAQSYSVGNFSSESAANDAHSANPNICKEYLSEAAGACQSAKQSAMKEATNSCKQGIVSIDFRCEYGKSCNPEANIQKCSAVEPAECQFSVDADNPVKVSQPRTFLGQPVPGTGTWKVNCLATATADANGWKSLKCSESSIDTTPVTGPTDVGIESPGSGSGTGIDMPGIEDYLATELDVDFAKESIK